MSLYTEMSREELKSLLGELQKQYGDMVAKGFKLDLSRGKPGNDQLNLSMDYLDAVDSSADTKAENGFDCRNYGLPEGIPEARRLMADMLEVSPESVMIGGNSSLNLMHDCMSIAYIHGLPGSKKPWGKLDEVKFLCPAPGYDRHFWIAEHFGFKLITVPMLPDGPDMDMVESLVAEDESIKGMWCVPKYTNPEGVSYSDETVRRLASLKPAADDFCIFYDNAYAVHELYPDDPFILLPLMPELIKAGRPNMAIQFTSTSKLVFPGSGISAFASGEEMMKHLMRHYGLQTISYDKMNQLRTARYFKDIDGIKAHMRRQATLLLPKFEAVLNALDSQISGTGAATWTKPRGGYFIPLYVFDGCAKRVVALCKEAGVALTTAGAVYPHDNDPKDSVIRIAPSYAVLEEVKQAADLLCLCVRLACVEKLVNS